MADETEVPPSATAQLPRVRRRAPTIDLKATEVPVDQPPVGEATAPAEPENTVPPHYSTEPPDYAAAPPPDEPPPRPAASPAQEPSPRSFIDRPVIEAGLAGGLVALVVFGVMWLGGALSGSGENPSDQRLAAMEARLRELGSRPAAPNVEAKAIDELTAQIGKLESAPRPAANSSAGVDEAVKPLQSAVSDVARRTEDNATAISEARGRADAALVAADAARLAVERTNVEALANRIAALESAPKPLTEEAMKNLAAGGDKPLRAAVAAQALQAAVERGDPFAAELAAVKAAAPNAPSLAVLEPFAATGLPSAAVLARQLSEAAATMQQATAAPAPSGGFLDRLQANAEKLVRVRPIGETQGDEPAAVVSRAQAKAARSDLAGAVADLKALPDSARAPVDAWIKRLKRAPPP